MRAQAFTSQFLSRPFPALALALAVAVAAAGIAAPVQASREASGADVVECKLPPQIRSLGRHATYLAAGRVVKIPVSECQVRGGTWSGGGPGALAGAAKIDGPLAVTVGGDGEGGACPLQGTVGGMSKGSTLAVRAGPGTSFARLDRLPNGKRVYLCDRAADNVWVGVVYGNGNQDCGLAAPITPPRAYNGPCRAGWVRSDYLR